MKHPIRTLLYELFVEPVLRVLEKVLGAPMALFVAFSKAGTIGFQWLKMKFQAKTTVR